MINTGKGNYSQVIKSHVKPIIVLLLVIIIGCDTSVTPTEKVIDVNNSRVDLKKRFTELGSSLREAEFLPVDKNLFKEKSIKHLLHISESDKRYSFVSTQFDQGYEAFYEKKPSYRKNVESVSNEYFDTLEWDLLSISVFDSTSIVFENFYNEIKLTRSLSIDQKNSLITKVVWYESTINFYHEYQDLFIPVETPYSVVDLEFKKCSWWDRWGKCAAGTIGGAITGGLSGCAVSAVPTAGFGCPAGATVGAIWGALTGAATFCDGCTEEGEDE